MNRNLIDEIIGHGTLPKWMLLPAYGRKYNTKQEAIEDFVFGKDFMLYQGPYCSIRDWGGEEVFIFCAGKFVKVTDEIKRDKNTK